MAAALAAVGRGGEQTRSEVRAPPPLFSILARKLWRDFRAEDREYAIQHLPAAISERVARVMAPSPVFCVLGDHDFPEWFIRVCSFRCLGPGWEPGFSWSGYSSTCFAIDFSVSRSRFEFAPTVEIGSSMKFDLAGPWAALSVDDIVETILPTAKRRTFLGIPGMVLRKEIASFLVSFGLVAATSAQGKALDAVVVLSDKWMTLCPSSVTVDPQIREWSMPVRRIDVQRLLQELAWPPESGCGSWTAACAAECMDNVANHDIEQAFAPSPSPYPRSFSPSSPPPPACFLSEPTLPLPSCDARAQRLGSARRTSGSYLPNLPDAQSADAPPPSSRLMPRFRHPPGRVCDLPRRIGSPAPRRRRLASYVADVGVGAQIQSNHAWSSRLPESIGAKSDAESACPALEIATSAAMGLCGEVEASNVKGDVDETSHGFGLGCSKSCCDLGMEPLRRHIGHTCGRVPGDPRNAA